MRNRYHTCLMLLLLSAANAAPAQVGGPFDYLRINGLGQGGPNDMVTDLSHGTADFLNDQYSRLFADGELRRGDGDLLDGIFAGYEEPNRLLEPDWERGAGRGRSRNGFGITPPRSAGTSRPFSFLSSGDGDHVVPLRARPSAGNPAVPRISLEVGPAPPSGLVGTFAQSPLAQ